MEMLDEVLDFLYQGAVDPREFHDLISKMSPDSADVHVNGPLQRKSKKEKAYTKKKREVEIGLANNLFGASAGAVATKMAYDQARKLKPKDVYSKKKKVPFTNKTVPVGRALKRMKVSPKGAVVVAGTTGVGAQLVNAGMDAQSAQYFARERASMKKEKVKKADYVDLNPRAIIPLPLSSISKKNDEFDTTWEGEISKVDEDKRQVFGWCSLTKVDGEDVVDRQGDYIPLTEVEKSAYNYVIHSRKGGDMHKRDGEVPLHTSDLIESFVVTPEKLEKLGLDENAIPHGWWVGFKVNDDKQWEDVKKGDRAHFSIHGKGKRKESYR